MGIKPLDKCNKGDIEKSSFKPEIPEFEVLVERSSTNDAVTVTLWKKQDDKFQVGYFRAGEKPRALRGYNELKDENKAWKAYEECCDGLGCSPYPKAQAYYKRKGIIS